MRTLPAVIALWGLTFVGLWPWVVWGHTFPNHAEPRVGSTVSVSPSCIRIWFDGPLEPAFSTLHVQNGSGRPIDKGDGRVSSSDATLIEVSLPPLSPGAYRVLWSVVGRDGHRTQGDYAFTVRPGR